MAGKLLITPNTGSTTAGVDPKIQFQGTGNSTDITLRTTTDGSLSFEGSSGQLFSISDSMSGTIFSANDVSGIPSIEVIDTGLVKLAQYSGNVVLGSATDNGTDKLQVTGNITSSAVVKGTTLTSTVATGTSPLTVASTTAVANLNADYLDGQHGSYYAPIASPTFTGTIVSPLININRAGNAASGIRWYNNTYTAWSEYMSDPGASKGPSGTITAPTGTLVTSWAKRSFIENTAGYGWTFESGTNASTTPAIVAEISSVNGAAKFSGAVTSPSFASTIATGTAPLTVTSTTVVPNLNADLHDGYNVAEAATVSTVVARNANGYIYTVHTNCSRADEASAAASYVYDSGDGWLRKKTLANAKTEIVTTAAVNSAAATTVGTVTSGVWNAGAVTSSGAVQGTRLVSTIAIGTAPLTVTSTTAVTNLNADLLDGQEGSYYQNATNLNAGTVATARLGSGTADTTTYLRGDSTWATITAGASVTNDTATNSNAYYPTLSTVITGTLSTAYTSSTKFYFNPSTGTLNSTSFNSLSDIAYKTNLKRLVTALDIVKSINGYEFDWKDESGSSYGIIAQEIEPLMPHAVATSDEGQKTVNYAAIIPFLVESIKTLSEQVEELKRQLK